MATIVRPMTSWGIFSLPAMPADPSTNQSEPLTSMTKPSARSSKLMRSSIFCFPFLFLLFFRRLFRLPRLVFIISISVEMSRYSGDRWKSRPPTVSPVHPISSRCWRLGQFICHDIIIFPMCSSRIFIS